MIIAGLPFLIVIGVVMMVAFYFYLQQPRQPDRSSPASFNPPLAQLAKDSPQIYSGSDFLTNSRLSHLTSFKVGKAGEDLVVGQLAQCLDSKWSIFRNVDLGDKSGDIDLALIGPGGIYALEVKAFSGEFKVENGVWYKQTRKGDWARQPYGPGAQARSNAQRLCAFLKANGMEKTGYITPIVVLANDHPIELVSSGTDVCKLKDLPILAANMSQRPQFSPQFVQQAVNALRQSLPLSA